MNEKQQTIAKRVVLGFLALLAIGLLIPTILSAFNPPIEPVQEVKGEKISEETGTVVQQPLEPVTEEGKVEEEKKPGVTGEPATSAGIMGKVGKFRETMGKVTGRREVRIGMILFAAALVILIVGIVLYQVRAAQQAQEEILPRPTEEEPAVIQPPPGPTQEELDSAKTWHIVRSVGGALSAGMLITGGVLLGFVIYTASNHPESRQGYDPNILEVQKTFFFNLSKLKVLGYTSLALFCVGAAGTLLTSIIFTNTIFGSMVGGAAIAFLVSAAFILFYTKSLPDLLAEPTSEKIIRRRLISGVFLLVGLLTAVPFILQVFFPWIMGI